MYYSDTRLFLGQLMLCLFTFLHCKCIFSLILFDILNKTHIFAVSYSKTRNESITIKYRNNGNQN